MCICASQPYEAAKAASLSIDIRLHACPHFHASTASKVIPSSHDYLPANHILHAPVLHSNGQISPFIKAPEGSIGGIAASSIGTSLGGVRQPSGGAAPMGLDGFSLTPLQVMIWLLSL